MGKFKQTALALILVSSAVATFILSTDNVNAQSTCPTGNCATIETEQALEGFTGMAPQGWVYTSGYTSAGDGGGGVLYGPPLSSCTSTNHGSCVEDSSGHFYSAQTFPINVQQWGADAKGVNPSTSAVKNEAAALFNTGGVIYFPPGSFLLSDITLPDQKSKGGAHVFCAGKDATTLILNADAYLFATYNYVNNDVSGAQAVEINGCKINLNYQNVSEPGIIIEATSHSRIHDNEIDNGYQAAVELTSLDIGPNPACNQGESGDYEVVRNVFINSYGPAVKGYDGGCSGATGANGLSDGLIQDNVFSANASGNGTNPSPDYQVTVDAAPGWEYRGNKSFGSTGCGELHLIGVGSSVITNNRIDISSNTVPASTACPSSTNVESVVIEMGAHKDFTFSGNSINNVAAGFPIGALGWDALEIIDSQDSDARGTVGDNAFANDHNFSLNAINYTGTYANGSQPLTAIGNAYGENLLAPNPANPAIILGTDQYLTVTVNATQITSIARFPVSGFTSSLALTQPQAAQSWGQTGVFTAAANCGQLVTAPGSSNTYVFHLEVNGAFTPVTCTFSGASTTGVGSGSTTIVTGQTADWKGVQSPSSVAANPSVNLVFARSN